MYTEATAATEERYEIHLTLDKSIGIWSRSLAPLHIFFGSKIVLKIFYLSPTLPGSLSLRKPKVREVSHVVSCTQTQPHTFPLLHPPTKQVSFPVNL